MDFTGKKLLVLCGNVIHIKVVEAAKEMGIYTIVTDSLPLQEAPAKQIADEALYLDVRDVDGIVEYCKNNKVDGVINFCNDLAQRPQQQICEKLGLPCYGTKEQYFQLTDKNAFKRMCKENNVDVIPEYTEAEIENDTVEYPVLVKPVDSRGSRGQAICYTKEELHTALSVAKNESSNGQAIIEKYMQGKQDFSMSYIFSEGRAYLTRTGDRFLGKKQDNLNKQCIGSVSPSRNTDFYLEKVNKRVVKMLQKIGIKNGPIFMQGFIDGDTVRFYDPGIRFPGTEYEKLLFKATGIDLMKSCIAFTLGGKIVVEKEIWEKAWWLGGKISIQLLITARAGVIGTFDGIDEIASHADVVTVAQRYFVGEEVPPTGDVKQRICEIALLTDKDKAKALVKWIQKKLIVLDERGENMLVSQFNPEILSGGILNVPGNNKFNHFRDMRRSVYLEQTAYCGYCVARTCGNDAFQRRIIRRRLQKFWRKYNRFDLRDDGGRTCDI